MAAKCFVIQPFDRGGPFDRRFEQTLKPSILAAGFEPYRVDRDPSSVILIDTIEVGIRTSRACVADISLDNPNVWLEVGFALALAKPMVLLCSAADRQKFPFDIQHRAIVIYDKESPSGYQKMGEELTDRLIALNNDADYPFLTETEEAFVRIIGDRADALDCGISATQLSEAVNDHWSSSMVEAKLKRLISLGVVGQQFLAAGGDERPVYGYCLTPLGMQWLEHGSRQRASAPPASVQPTD